MVAKINRGKSLYGALAYNQQKIDKSIGRLISGNRIITEPGDTMRQMLLSFENYLLANKNTEKPVLHISLNPSPRDCLTDREFAQLAHDYMTAMGYGQQPYVVFLHEDTGRRHIHIVSVCVDEMGNKISDKYEWNRSMKACRELEIKYNMEQSPDKKQELTEPYLKKADYQAGNLKQQVSNILKSVFTTYRFQTFGEYNALLSCFNIEARQVKGEHNGVPYNGVIYVVTDDKGIPLSAPIKSSLIDKKFGYKGLSKRIAHNIRDFKDGKWKPDIRNKVLIALGKSRGQKNNFRQFLHEQGIDVIFRENEQGRIYGVTFIDHNTRQVFNGSRMGKEFSANAFEKIFNNHISKEEHSAAFISEEKEMHDFTVSEATSLEAAFGVFAFEQHGTDLQEEAFARLTRKKKKSKRRGIGR